MLCLALVLARLKTNTQIYEAFSMITRPDCDDEDVVAAAGIGGSGVGAGFIYRKNFNDSCCE
jgi:hypothetical protein